MKILLFLFSIIYAAISSLRNFLFDIGIFRAKSFSIPIICIGNLNVGGSGKTPHTDYIFKILAHKKVAIISRGYRRKSKNLYSVKIDSDFNMVGDEPLMLKRKNPNALVVVCAKRIKAINYIIKNHHDIEVILLDDGFQHRWVKAGLNILLTSYHKPFYKDHLLPYGHLRENKKQSKRADYIVTTNIENDLKSSELKSIKNEISKISQAKSSFSSIKYLEPRNIFNHEIFDIAGCNIVLISGIANTVSLEKYIKTQSSIIKHFKFNDHHNYNKEDIKNILSYCDSIKSTKKIILTTEKDSVKLVQFKEDFKNMEVVFLPIEIMMLDQGEFNKKIIRYVDGN
jgi:tetraacyldisaccharide 4'-kinase